MANMTQEQMAQEFATLYDKLTPDCRWKIAVIMKGMARKEQKQNAVMMAVRYAKLDDVSRGAEVMEHATMIDGRIAMNAFDGSRYVLAGLAFAAGIAEGKQRERERRRFARMKAKIRAATAAKVE